MERDGDISKERDWLTERALGGGRRGRLGERGTENCIGLSACLVCLSAGCIDECFIKLPDAAD